MVKWPKRQLANIGWNIKEPTDSPCKRDDHSAACGMGLNLLQISGKVSLGDSKPGMGEMPAANIFVAEIDVLPSGLQISALRTAHR